MDTRLSSALDRIAEKVFRAGLPLVQLEALAEGALIVEGDGHTTLRQAVDRLDAAIRRCRRADELASDPLPAA